jgi:SNF2 family DNA or RNA helicase
MVDLLPRTALKPVPLPAGWSFYTDPFPHQATAISYGWKKKFFAYLMEQGTGKTKVTLDNVSILRHVNAIDAFLVLAPKDVHEQWVEEQIPAHWNPEQIIRPVIWSQSMAQRRHARELYERPIRGHFPILAMNHDAISHDEGFKTARNFLRKYTRCFVANDESHRMKTPKATRTRRLQMLSQDAWVRRILTGTPSTQSPFDLYAQFRFLHEGIIGFDSFIAFKHHYGVFATEMITVGKGEGRKIRTYESLQMYARLDELGERIGKYCYRVKKIECLKLPPKMPIPRKTHMSDHQRAIYDQLMKEGIALLEEKDEAKRLARLAKWPELPQELAERVSQAKDRVTYKIKLTLLLRLQQILGGFVTDDEKNVTRIDEITPRMQDTLDLVEQAEGKVIIWACFKPEIEALTALLRDKGEQVASYYGATSKAQRSDVNARFRDREDPLRILVANQKSAGVGRDWAVAQTMIYYSNLYSVEMRQQTEDRAHRIGLQGTLSIYDFFCKGSPIDRKIRDAHQRGIDLAEQVLKSTTEQFKEMIQ